jgi:hypothetical protein
MQAIAVGVSELGKSSGKAFTLSPDVIDCKATSD